LVDCFRLKYRAEHNSIQCLILENQLLVWCTTKNKFYDNFSIMPDFVNLLNDSLHLNLLHWYFC
jgi:hypothetical protein